MKKALAEEMTFKLRCKGLVITLQLKGGLRVFQAENPQVGNP